MWGFINRWVRRAQPNSPAAQRGPLLDLACSEPVESASPLIGASDAHSASAALSLGAPDAHSASAPVDHESVEAPPIPQRVLEDASEFLHWLVAVPDIEVRASASDDDTEIEAHRVAVIYNTYFVAETGAAPVVPQALWRALNAHPAITVTRHRIRDDAGRVVKLPSGSPSRPTFYVIDLALISAPAGRGCVVPFARAA